MTSNKIGPLLNRLGPLGWLLLGLASLLIAGLFAYSRDALEPGLGSDAFLMLLALWWLAPVVAFGYLVRAPRTRLACGPLLLAAIVLQFAVVWAKHETSSTWTLGFLSAPAGSWAVVGLAFFLERRHQASPD